MDRVSKILAAQFVRTQREGHEYLKFALDPCDIRSWYVIMHHFSGDEDEFSGGEYICKVNVTDKYPYDPPRFQILTPNGVYDVNKEVCISIGKYHAQNYRAGLGIVGFVCQLVSGMIGWKSIGEGMALMHTTTAEKKAFANTSSSYNSANHAEILGLFA